MTGSLVATFFTLCWTIVLGGLAYLAFDSVRILIKVMKGEEWR